MTPAFVSGHAFSRAEPQPRKTWPLGPEVKVESRIQFVNESLTHYTSALPCPPQPQEAQHCVIIEPSGIWLRIPAFSIPCENGKR